MSSNSTFVLNGGTKSAFSCSPLRDEERGGWKNTYEGVVHNIEILSKSSSPQRGKKEYHGHSSNTSVRRAICIDRLLYSRLYHKLLVHLESSAIPDGMSPAVKLIH